MVEGVKRKVMAARQREGVKLRCVGEEDRREEVVVDGRESEKGRSESVV